MGLWNQLSYSYSAFRNIMHGYQKLDTHPLAEMLMLSIWNLYKTLLSLTMTSQFMIRWRSSNVHNNRAKNLDGNSEKPHFPPFFPCFSSFFSIFDFGPHREGGENTNSRMVVHHFRESKDKESFEFEVATKKHGTQTLMLHQICYSTSTSFCMCITKRLYKRRKEKIFKHHRLKVHQFEKHAFNRSTPYDGREANLLQKPHGEMWTWKRGKNSN